MAALKTISFRINETVSEAFRDICNASDTRNQGEMIEKIIRFYSESKDVLAQLEQMQAKCKQLQSELDNKTQIENSELSEKSKEISDLQAKLDAQSKNENIQIAELQNKISELETGIEELHSANSELWAKHIETSTDAIIIEDTPLFHALVYECCKLESERTGKDITPRNLFKAMFRNYVVKGEMFLFKTPSYGRCRQLSKKYADVCE